MAGGKLISTGVEFPDATTQTTSGLPLTGGTMTGTIAGFTSTGIDDNATSTAITMLANGRVGLATTNPLVDLQIGDTSATMSLGGTPTVNGTGRLKFINTNTQSNWQISHNDSASSTFQIAHSTATGGSTFSTPDLTIKNNGNVAVVAGNLVIGTSGKGIDFSATSDGSGTMTSEVLDDYEEGNYTATLTMGSGTASLSTADVAYTKVGRLVTISGQVRIGSVSSPSGTMQISLPFTCLSGNNTVGNYRSYLIDTPNDGVQAVLSTEDGQALANFQWSRDNATSTNENATSGGYLMVGLTYMTA